MQQQLDLQEGIRQAMGQGALAVQQTTTHQQVYNQTLAETGSATQASVAAINAQT